MGRKALIFSHVCCEHRQAASPLDALPVTLIGLEHVLEHPRAFLPEQLQVVDRRQLVEVLQGQRLAHLGRAHPSGPMMWLSVRRNGCTSQIGDLTEQVHNDIVVS